MQGRAHLRQPRAGKSFESAVRLFKQVIAHDEQFAEAYMENGEDALARQTYQRAIDLQPNYWKAHMGMGNYFFENGLPQEAIPYYRRITELMPKDGASLNNLSAALFLSGQFEQAARYWEESLALERSLVLDYPWHLARADASLKSLQGMPRYQALSARQQ